MRGGSWLLGRFAAAAAPVEDATAAARRSMGAGGGAGGGIDAAREAVMSHTPRGREPLDYGPPQQVEGAMGWYSTKRKVDGNGKPRAQGATRWNDGDREQVFYIYFNPPKAPQHSDSPQKGISEKITNLTDTMKRQGNEAWRIYEEHRARRAQEGQEDRQDAAYDDA